MLLYHHDSYLFIAGQPQVTFTERFFFRKYSTVFKAHGLLSNFVNRTNFEKTGSNAKCFPCKTSFDILTSLDKKGKVHADIEELYKDMVEIYSSLAELHLCHCNDDTEKAVELVLNEGVDINIPAQSNRTPLLVASLSSSRLSSSRHRQDSRSSWRSSKCPKN